MIECLQNAESSQPFLFIQCLGDKLITCQVFTIISGKAIKAESLLEAVDICFKAFFVFDINHTKQRLPTWEFLQRVVSH